MRIWGEDDKGHYVKLRGDHGDYGSAEGFEGLVEPSFSKKLASLWYWIRLVLLVMCLVLLAGYVRFILECMNFLFYIQLTYLW
ncbi:hypothetical protein PRUPE_3G013400 [Prunus persica]|uniref:Uncharacterized protein n=1 Tax=Prunus persica TaxID=3760 RepID=A0A251PTE7_PRUPE|nr:hypothetical protein PRUPE_3G013400 [Prunus persica]